MSEIARLEQRKRELLDETATQRRDLHDDLQEVARGARRVDGWLVIARRMTPVVAAGLTVAAIVAGPARVLRLVRGSFVPALLVRQLFSGRR